MRLILLGSLLFLLILAGISWGVKKFKALSLFRIDEVELKGDVEIDVSPLVGRNIFELSVDEIRGRYETEQVKLVRAKRRFPRKVVIEVERRKPFLLLEHKKTYEVDVEGYILGPTKRRDLPMVKLMGEEKPLEVWKARCRQVIDVVHLLRDDSSLREMRLCENDLIVMADQKIRLGADDWTVKLRKLNHVNLEKLGTCEIDLRFRDQIVIK
ncbi:hypothetical protein AMJ40_03635 [candidate division TA06 bacterium DG_26]|uniref:POTRA domain-containing protein n=1 Tax=candidate division TA06 bacterium DG_26 TaxID=1703771 RepID=A0A0S7WJ19_UNCT6|nr:MAG: hypothetical protein AMJ40_03635 [candidate division TA06 bacterium DG_26]